MYNEYFGFKEAPFSIAPDPRYLYMTAQHREALAHLVYGLNSEGGCILLTGEVGTGKTTICCCLLEQIPDQANVALVLNPKVNEIELLETICDELKINYPESDNSLKTYTDRIYDFLIERNSKNEKTVLIIDEAQNLDSKVLEQLRLLTNLETHQRKLLQIIILGQPELLDILAKNEMRQLAQRITARFHLQPLTKTEVKFYVNHRLAVAGQNIHLFPESCIKLLYKLSKGVPRLINIISDRALLGAYVDNQYTVNPVIIKKAAKEVFGELKNVEQQQKKRQWLYAFSAVLAITIIGITLFFSLTPKNNNNIAVIAEPADKTKSLISDSDIQTSSEPTLGEPISIEETSETKSETAYGPDTQGTTEAFNSDEAIPTDTLPTEDELEKTPVGVIDHISEILSHTSDSKATAFQQLFKAWNQPYDKTGLTTACEQAAELSLSCLHKQGNINSLKSHNRPAILALINEQGITQHITITAINNDVATVYADNTAYTVKLSDLDKYWYGSFILLWKKPAFYSTAITPGDRGDMINWLYTQLSTINNHNVLDMAINTYDDYMIKQVKDFQLQQGLTADGIVGPVTIMHLNTHSGMKVPLLIPSTTSSTLALPASSHTEQS